MAAHCSVDRTVQATKVIRVSVRLLNSIVCFKKASGKQTVTFNELLEVAITLQQLRKIVTRSHY
jgi:hypothetical protein